VTVVPDHPRLRPGVHAVRRDAEHWQIGLDAGSSVLVRDTPDARDLLDVLSGRTSCARTSSLPSRLLTELATHDLLLEPRRAGPPPRSSVGLVSCGLDLGPLASMLDVDGVPLTSPGEAAAVADVYVIASAAPLPRSSLDLWVADGTPHLPISGTGRPGQLRVGPFVEPGASACLRCVDAHESAHDPRRPLIIEQLSALPAAPVSPSTRLLALAWAAQDVARFLRGEQPGTWSTTVELGGATPEIRTWARHPHCGCSWDQLGY